MPIKVFSDGGSRGNPGPSASAFVVYEEDKIIHTSAKFLGIGTNNNAEYEAVLMAVSWISENIEKGTDILFNLDSELVVRQLKGIYKIKDANLQKLASQVKHVIALKGLKIVFSYIPRNLNKIADKLVNECIDKNT